MTRMTLGVHLDDPRSFRRPSRLLTLAMLDVGCAEERPPQGEQRVRIVKNADAPAEVGGIPPDKQADIQLMPLQQREPSVRKCHQRRPQRPREPRPLVQGDGRPPDLARVRHQGRREGHRASRSSPTRSRTTRSARRVVDKLQRVRVPGDSEPGHDAVLVQVRSRLIDLSPGRWLAAARTSRAPLAPCGKSPHCARVHVSKLGASGYSVGLEPPLAAGGRVFISSAFGLSRVR